MLRPATLVLAAAIALVAPSFGVAKPKPIDFDTTCSCTCKLPSGWEDGIGVKSKLPVDCTAYVGKTCNAEDSKGLIRSGTITFCTPASGETAADTLPSFTPTTPPATLDGGRTTLPGHLLRLELQPVQ